MFDWPKCKLELPEFGRTVKSASLLPSGEALKLSQKNGKITIRLPGSAPDAIASVIELRVQG